MPLASWDRSSRWGETQPSRGYGFGGGPGGFVGGPGRGSLTAFAYALAPWRDQLDQRATEALDEVGPGQGTHILGLLSEQSRKGVNIVNPSAYIIRACRNAQLGIDGRGDPAAKRQRMSMV